MPYPHVERHSQTGNDKQVVRELAYKLWQEAGEPPNCSLHFWLEAERQLEQTTGSGNAIQERR